MSGRLCIMKHHFQVLPYFSSIMAKSVILTIYKLHNDKPVTAGMVEFNKEDYPDAEVIDMR